MKTLSKSGIAIVLSKLKVFEKPKVELEQYPTDSEIAATVLWNAYLQGDLTDKTIADLGCGTGILGIGALILGAKQVFFVDIDQSSLEICKSNIEWTSKEVGFEGQYIVNNSEVRAFNEKVDVVIQNPPFGAKIKQADREFVEKGLELGDVLYTIHNANSKEFIDKFIYDKKGKVTHYWEFMLALKQSMHFHTKAITRIKVGCWRVIKS